jgi:hypothetical protein
VRFVFIYYTRSITDIGALPKQGVWKWMQNGGFAFGKPTDNCVGDG